MATPPTAVAKEPAAAVVRAASRHAPGKALDIACGFGRHAIWLAEHGWTVTAVDRNPDAIAQIRTASPAIDARCVDLEEAGFTIEPASYDLIVCWLYFQRDLLPLIRNGVRSGGIAAVCALLEGRFAAAPGELLSHFDGWTILHEVETSHGPGKRACELVVQRTPAVK